MPKMKSHTGMGKRVKVTGTGKLVSEPAGKRHKLQGKTTRHKRALSGTTLISKVDAPRVKKLLGR
jgi:large subunit ribosomal protein L35